MRLRGDMHMHSTCSDGRNSPEEVLLTALEKGFDFISLTDHDTFCGSIKARRLAEEAGYDIVVIIGAEIRTEQGDVLVYCPGEPPARLPRDAVELAEHVRAEGCLAVPAHPFDLRRKGIGETVFRGRWDAIEVFNAMSDPLSNRRAEEAARQLGLPGLANSDAHVASTIASAYNIVDAQDASPEAILEAIRRGRVSPVPGRPGIGAVASTVLWSIERKLRGRRRSGPSRLDYLEEGQ